MKLRAAIFLIFSMATSCKEPFSPEIDPSNRDLLVVEGHLAIGEESTFVLSRTGDLNDPQARKPEANVKMLVEDAGNTVVQASSDKNGVCSLPTQNLLPTKNYRLRMIRPNGKIYETDYLENKAAPEIDHVNFEVEGEGFKIHLSTHDPSNRTKFYSWKYVETWEIRSPIISYWELTRAGIVERDQSINMTRCWQGNASSSILLGSTERLSEDLLSRVPITFIPGTSIKLGYTYSILVSQFAMTREGYQYLEAMKKNTEEIGTIFDPQPTELRGNIKCVSNQNEVVIGYISSGAVSKKRIFIRPFDRPRYWGGYRDNLFCTPKIIHGSKVMEALLRDSLIEYRSILADPFNPQIADTTYTMTTRTCVDCRSRGGSNIKPSYWPD